MYLRAYDYVLAATWGVDCFTLFRMETNDRTSLGSRSRRNGRLCRASKGNQHLFLSLKTRQISSGECTCWIIRPTGP